MTTLILSVFIKLLQVVSHESMSHANLLMPPSISSPVQLVTYMPTNTTVGSVVSVSAFSKCNRVTGGTSSVTRVRYTHVPVSNRDGDTPSDEPTCVMPSSDSVEANSYEAPDIIPLTKEQLLSQQSCMVIATSHYDCEISSGSLLSAFPLT